MNNIVEHIKRDDDASAVPVRLSISSIAGLPQTDHLEDSTLFEISVLDTHSTEKDKYTSKSTSWATIMAKLQHTTLNHFNNRYRALRFVDVAIPDETDNTKTTIYRFLTQPDKWAGNWDGNRNLPAQYNTNEPCVWGDIKTLAWGEVVLSQWMKRLDDRLSELENTKLAFSSTMDFHTTMARFVDERGSIEGIDRTQTISAAYRDPSSGVNSNGFVVAFWQGSKISTSYTCQEDGMLTLYGWLDSSNVQNIKYLPSAWCALEGKIRGQWEILSIQSVIPAKQFSYVGFCVPVLKNLTIRLELGFIPGEASGRYDHDKIPESLANTQPNAFLGGVYSPKYEPATESTP